MVNLSVIKHYFVDRQERDGFQVFSKLVLPLTGFLLTVWLWTSLSGTTLIVGLCWAGSGIRVAGRGYPWFPAADAGAGHEGVTPAGRNVSGHADGDVDVAAGRLGIRADLVGVIGDRLGGFPVDTRDGDVEPGPQ